MQTGVVLAVLVAADVAGNLCLTTGMKQVGAVNTLKLKALGRLAQRLVTNPYLGQGIFWLTIGFGMFLVLLSANDLSFALPATALTDPANALASRFILHEKVTPARWLGILLIGVGVILIAHN